MIKLVPLICSLLLAVSAGAQEPNPCKTGGQTCYFGIETNDVLYGYAIENYCDGIFEGERVRYEYSVVTLKMSLLGANMDAGFEALYIINQATNRTVRIELKVINGESVVKTITKIIPTLHGLKAPALELINLFPSARMLSLLRRHGILIFMKILLLTIWKKKNIKYMIRLKVK